MDRREHCTPKDYLSYLSQSIPVDANTFIVKAASADQEIVDLSFVQGNDYLVLRQRNMPYITPKHLQELELPNQVTGRNSQKALLPQGLQLRDRDASNSGNQMSDT